jgi:hypothetical protein
MVKNCNRFINHFIIGLYLVYFSFNTSLYRGDHSFIIEIGKIRSRFNRNNWLYNNIPLIEIISSILFSVGTHTTNDARLNKTYSRSYQKHSLNDSGLQIILIQSLKYILLFYELAWDSIKLTANSYSIYTTNLLIVFDLWIFKNKVQIMKPPDIIY